MSQKKGGGSSKNGRDSKSKRLGVKRFAGQVINAGTILVRQRGTRFFPGVNVSCGRDYTLFSKINGKITFETKKMQKLGKTRRFISVYPVDAT